MTIHVHEKCKLHKIHLNNLEKGNLNNLSFSYLCTLIVLLFLKESLHIKHFNAQSFTLFFPFTILHS